MKNTTYLALPLLVLLPLTSTGLMAADIARDVRAGETAPYSEDGGYFEMGGGLGLFTNQVVGEADGVGVGIFIAGRYQWKGLFVESIDTSSTNFALGYNALNTDHWSFDLIGSSLNWGGISDDNKELEGLDDRDGDFLFGARATGYYGNYIVQLQVLDDISDTHNGMIAAVEAGRSWQVRNWNFHTVLGLRYQEKEVVNYYLGVSPEEAAATSLAEYSSDGGALLTAEIGATYPMTENWVFRATADFVHLTDNLSDSPIIEDADSGAVSATFSYVF